MDWIFKRLTCFFKGCNKTYWHENEYVGGTDCSRCEAGIESTGYKTSHKLFEGNLIARLFPRFWMDYFE